jgi:glycosyltransferase involved in cell wall biosynthesis
MFGISVVVVSYNSEAIIEPTLVNLFSQKLPENILWEIILVNNNSSDNTIEISQKLALQYNFPNFKIVNETKPGTAFARFKGVSEAKYNIICFVDDDNRISDNFIETAYNIMQNEEIGILGCGGEGEFETEPPIWFESEKNAYAIGSLYPNESIKDVTFDANLPTACMCIRKEIFESLNAQNWKPQLTGRIGNMQAPGEDTELCQAARLLGYKIFYTNELHFVHYMPSQRISWGRFLQMTYGFGVTDVFLLPYRLIHEKRENGAALNYYFRKKWFLNYFGKKISLFINLLKYKIGQITFLNFEKIKARNLGFCETILREKKQFSDSFSQINNLKKVIG